MGVRRGAPRGLMAVLIAAVVLWPAAAASGTAFKRAAAYPVPAPPVVLVTGLDDSTPGMGPGGNCSSVGSMASLCSALQNAGHKVYVVSSRSGSGAVIDNHAAFDGNASSLAHYLATVVKTPALLVGHSMGGILSRIAISRYGAASVGLFTIGSPHDGSFGADIVEGAAGLPCSGVICLGLQSAAKLILSHMGSGAVADLTQSARTADNANLSRPGSADVDLCRHRVQRSRSDGLLLPGRRDRRPLERLRRHRQSRDRPPATRATHSTSRRSRRCSS